MATSCLPIVVCVFLGGGPAVVSPTHATSSAIVANDGQSMTYGELPGGCTDARYLFDAQDAWIHGYYQEVPAYGGFAAFRPYNYKHVLMQSSIAAGWGMSPVTPYSQQFWRRYQSRAAMTDEQDPDREAVSGFPADR